MSAGDEGALLSQLREDWEKLAESSQLLSDELRDVEFVHLATTVVAVTSLEDAMSRVDALCGEHKGWLRCFSWAGRVGPGFRAPSWHTAGAPLEGEWASQDRRESNRLVYLGRANGHDSVWRLITLREDDAGRPVLKERTSLLASKLAEPAGRLCYAVYWGAPKDDRAGVRRVASRFLGFHDADAKGQK
jgi:hypothetical protein